MKLSQLLLFFFLVTGLSVSCSRHPEGKEAELTRRIDSLLHTIPDFSGVILVADKGKVRYHKSFGYRDITRKTPLDTADIFELASVSKQFTAMIIMMLEAQEKLRYDDSIAAYIPNFPYHGITIRHLLTHTSGLPDYQAVMDEHWDKSKVAGNSENIDYLLRYRPPILFKPGDAYAYSNTGYMLLATIAEKASGEDFISLCRSRIFTPLNMTNTDIRTREEKARLKNMALGSIYVPEKKRYVPADSFPEFNYTIWLGNRKGPGRISSTATDLLKWDQALYGETLIRQSALATAFSPMKLNNDSLSNYGFGWEISEGENHQKIVSHTGDNPGYKTEIVRYIESGQTIILLNNNAHARKKEIMDFLKRVVPVGQL